MSESNKSTGPRTPEGKAISSMNALKHGLNARDVVLKNDEEREEFAVLNTDLGEELNPTGVLETLIFNRLVRATWDLRRVERMEVVHAAEGCDLHDNYYQPRLDRFARYKMRAERSFYKAHHELAALQAERQAPAEAQAQQEAADPVRFGEQPTTLRHRNPETGLIEPFSSLHQPPDDDNASPEDLTPPSAA